MINKPSKGAESAQQFRQAIAEEEHKIEREKNSEMKKGEERVEERSRSSDGKGPGEKQRG